MEPRDKFGREIYPNAFAKMQGYGRVLSAHGYAESRMKPNLFYRADREHEGVVYFADMRGTQEVPIWSDPSPLFYVKFENELPDWLRNRLAGEEFGELRICRESYEIDFDEYHTQGGNGYCIVCGKDFQDEGLYCSPLCTEADLDLGKDACQVCGAIVTVSKLVRHHLSYEEHKIILVCRSCHLKIHRGAKLPHLKPKG